MTKNEILKQLDSYYKEKQLASSLDFKKRFNFVFENDLKFRELELQRRQLTTKLFQDKDDQALKEQLAIVKKELSNYIKQNNIDLSLKVSCIKCKDTGYCDGKMCECKKDRYLKMLYKSSHLPAIAKNYSFDKTPYSFNVKQSEYMKSLYEWISNKWIKNFDTATKQVIFIDGNVGVGKTCLAFSAANELIKNGFSVYYATAFDLNNIFVDNKFNRDTYEDDYESIMTCDCLIIDDLGTEITNSIGIEYLFNVIDSRINSLKKTIICTNLSLKSFSNKYGERSASRLTNTRYSLACNYIEGEDLRKI